MSNSQLPWADANQCVIPLQVWAGHPPSDSKMILAISREAEGCPESFLDETDIWTGCTPLQRKHNLPGSKSNHLDKTSALCRQELGEQLKAGFQHLDCQAWSAALLLCAVHNVYLLSASNL